MKKTTSNGWGEKFAPYILLSPFLFMLLVFFGYAFIRCIYFSFTTYNLFHPAEWVGIQNYLNLFKEIKFGRAFANSLTYSLIVTTAQTFFALLLALFLNQKFRGIKFFRAVFFLPSVASSVVVALVFMWLYQKQGLINFLATKVIQNYQIILTFIFLSMICQVLLFLYEKLRKMPISLLEPSFISLSVLVGGVLTFILFINGYISTLDSIKPVEIVWLNTRQTWPAWAGPLAFPIPLGAIMMINIWTTSPTFMLLYLAGLQEIPAELYEAASVDGANKFQSFRYIIIPQLKHVTFLIVSLGLIGTLQLFDTVQVMGGQAPEDSVVTLAYYSYTNMMPQSATPRVGMASAAAIFLACLTVIIVLLQKKLVKAGGDE